MINLEWKTAWVNTEALRFRDGPGLGFNFIQWLSQGQEIAAAPEVAINDGKIVWWLANVGGRYGFVASGYLSLTRPQPVPVPTPQPAKLPAMIGLHFHVGGNSEAGRAVIGRHKTMCATVINDIGLANRIYQDNPDMTVIWRLVLGDHDPNPTDGKYRWNELRPMWEQLNPGILIQIANEWFSRGNLPVFKRVYLDAMDAAHAEGRKITVCDFGVGKPEPADLPDLDEVFDKAARYGMPVNYHAYSSEYAPDTVGTEPEYYELRWLEFAARNPQLKFVLGECGTFNATFISTQHMIEQMTRMKALLEPHRDKLLGAAWWTLGGQGQYGFEYSSIDTALADYERWLG